MLNYLKSLFRRKKKPVYSDTEIQLMRDNLNFFYKEAMKAYNDAMNAIAQDDEETLELKRKHFKVAHRRHTMVKEQWMRYIKNQS